MSAMITAGKARARRIVQFIEKYIVVPEGMLVGKPMVLLPEQIDFINAVYGDVDEQGLLVVRRGIFSIARKNGKSGLISALVGAHLIGPEAKRNSKLISAARSRDQASIVFRYLAESLRFRKDLEGLVDITDSAKMIKGLAVGTEYKAISADATTAHGANPALTIHDELGQVIGSNDPLYNALETAGGAQLEPLSLIISTQAASDTDLLSILIDDALRNPTPENVVRLYAAEKKANIFDPKVWKAVNFALGIFRTEKEFREAAERAERMPSSEATFRNLYLNQRISLLQLLIAPSVWAENAGAVDDSIFTSGLPVHIGADLSQSRDLTAVVAAVLDPDTNLVQLKCWTFTPLDNLELRAKIDKAAYPQWVREGHLIALPGINISYDMVAEFLADNTQGMNIVKIHFDRWRIPVFKKACEEAECFVETNPAWSAVGQGYQSMTPRLDVFENILLENRLRHGNNPVLNMAAANAVAAMDPARNRKLEKAKSSARIDPLVAAVMAVYGPYEPAEKEEEEVTDDSLVIL